MIYEHIPQELQARRAWVCWGAPGDKLKCPYNPEANTRARAGKPDSWTDFHTAAAAVSAGRYQGIGFEFAGDGIVGIDFDHCIIDGQLDPWAAHWVEQFGSYTEVSPSGEGLHILCKGKLPGAAVKRKQAEMYEQGRYFTVTGNAWGKPGELRKAQAAIDALYKELSPDQTAGSHHVTDEQLIKQNTHSRQRGKVPGDRMNREQAKAYIREQEPDFLEQAPHNVNGRPSYVCPNPDCGSGSGPHGTGIACDPKDGVHWHCFACGLHEDVIGLWMKQNGTEDTRQAFEELYDYYGITVDDARSSAPQDFAQPVKEDPAPVEPVRSFDSVPAADQSAPAEDLAPYYRECAQRVQRGETDYFTARRGLPADIVQRFGLGYDPAFTEGTGGRSWGAVIIPTSGSTFVARNTDPSADSKNRYRKHGPVQLLNPGALRSGKPVFVVEGEFDAISIIAAGFEALALGSTSNYMQLVRLIQKEGKPSGPLLLALDNDDKGQQAAEKLAPELGRLQVPFFTGNPFMGEKDANAAWVKDPAGLRSALADAVQNVAAQLKAAEEAAIEEARRKLEEEKADYEKETAAAHLQEFLNGIAESVNTPYIPTGYPVLDKHLDGGLYEGLYILGAVSSLGKTTFVLQAADQIAESGTDVLIFSLEMARTELMSKSISRLTLMDALQNGGNTRNAKTARGITTGSQYAKYSPTERELIRRSVEAYGKFAGRIYIIQGIGDIGVKEIREKVEKHIRCTGRKPVVIIDYLQILAPADVRASDKQNTDKAVLELKRLSRDYKLPVVGISSFNRENYKEKVSMVAFKESGAIEYGSDVLLGLQFEGAGEKDFDLDRAKDRNPRAIELRILKNRNGATGKRVRYDYYQMFNYFKECDNQ